MPVVASQELLSHRRKQSPFVHPRHCSEPPSWPPVIPQQQHALYVACRVSNAAGLIKSWGSFCRNFTVNDGPSLPPMMTQGLGS